MTLYDKIVATYPELTDNDFDIKGSIRLQNDGDGDYIAKWEYHKPIPAGMKVGK